MTNRRYLFVCGCPRSGTSALTTLLNTHPLIALGIERYKRYAKPDKIQGLNQSKFNESSFFKIQPKHTNINSTHKNWDLKWKNIYDELKDKFKNENLIVGDKYPYYYRFYESLNSAFDRPKFIFVFRNIHEVASSYNTRAANPKDRWKTTHNYVYAVKDWNDALTQTWQYLEKSDPNLLLCEYEKLFYGDRESLERVLNFLEINLDTTIEKYYREMIINWQQRLLKPQNLNFEQVKYIDGNANWVLRDRLVQKYGHNFADF